MPEGGGRRLRRSDAINDTCPWSGDPISADALTRYRGQVVGFCNTDCRDKFAVAVSYFETALARSEAQED